MASERSDTEQHSYHGWPIRVVCEFQVTEGKFAARSYVTPSGLTERVTPGPASLETLSIEAKGHALKAAKRYIDSMLVD